MSDGTRLGDLIAEAVQMQSEKHGYWCWYCQKPRSRLIPVWDVGAETLKFYCFPCLLTEMERYRREDIPRVD